jgi:hypothetical protein
MQRAFVQVRASLDPASFRSTSSDLSDHDLLPENLCGFHPLLQKRQRLEIQDEALCCDNVELEHRRIASRVGPRPARLPPVHPCSSSRRVVTDPCSTLETRRGTGRVGVRRSEGGSFGGGDKHGQLPVGELDNRVSLLSEIGEEVQKLDLGWVSITCANEGFPSSGGSSDDPGSFGSCRRGRCPEDSTRGDGDGSGEDAAGRGRR